MMKSLCVGKDGKLRPWVQLLLIFGGVLMAQFIIGAVAGLWIVFWSGVWVGMQGIPPAAEDVLLGIPQTVWFTVLVNGLNTVVGIGALVVLYREIMKSKLDTMGLTSIRSSWKHLMAGLLMGCALITLLVGALVLRGEYRFVGLQVSFDLVLGLIAFIGVGFYEEMLVRGAFQHIILRKHKIVWAVLVPSVLFSVMHFGNPNIGGIAVLNLFLAGVFFALLTYKTGNLWMAIGVHITWNYTMGNLFGIEVSGLTLGKGLIQMERVQDTVLNGGNFGLEGGYLCTGLLCLMIIGCLVGCKKRLVSNSEEE